MTYVKRKDRPKADPDLVKLADSLIANYKKPEDLIGENGLLKRVLPVVLPDFHFVTCELPMAPVRMM